MKIIDPIQHNVGAIAAAMGAFAAGIVFCAAVAIPETKPVCEIIAVTYSGDEYVLGVGDTCRDALRGNPMAHAPNDWREIKTQMATRGIHIR